MSKRRVTYTFALMSLGLSCAPSTYAVTRTVGKPNTPCPNPEYGTITAAITDSAPGDEIAICPALYPEQLVITKPLALRGLAVNGINRVLLKPAAFSTIGLLPIAAVISVINTEGVTIEGLAIDASDNTVRGCDPPLAGVRFSNSSGTIRQNAIFGAQLKNPQSCPALFPGNGFGVHVDANRAGPFRVSVENNSIHDFTRNGILVVGAGVVAGITGNSISGIGPASGAFQFGVFIANGAVAQVIGNMISEGTCGALSNARCLDVRSQGIVLRAVGDGTIIDGNTITNAQSGIFINGGNDARITNNIIRNIDVLSGIHVQGNAAGRFTNSLISGNKIYNVGPVNNDASINQEGCGINEISNTGIAGNTIADNLVSDAYCGVAYVSADQVRSGFYINTLYATFNSDLYLTAYPPAIEPH